MGVSALLILPHTAPTRPLSVPDSSLAEKAYFKLHNDYMSLAGGVTTEAIENLTGCVVWVSHGKEWAILLTGSPLLT